MLQDSHPRSSRGVSGDDPEGGAGSGVLRQAARNRSPREARDPALQALRPGCEELAARIRKAPARRCRTAGAQGDGSAAPGAQNRHGGAPRGERPASWDARRLASAWHAASWRAPRVLRTHPNVSRRSASNSIKQLNQLGNYCRFAAIPAFFPVRKQHNALNSTREPGHVHHGVVRHHTLSRRHLASGANRCIRHHPPANFDSCSTG